MVMQRYLFEFSPARNDVIFKVYKTNKLCTNVQSWVRA